MDEFSEIFESVRPWNKKQKIDYIVGDLYTGSGPGISFQFLFLHFLFLHYAGALPVCNGNPAVTGHVLQWRKPLQNMA